MRHKKYSQIGEKAYNKQGYLMTIIEYSGANNIKIEFNDKKHTKQNTTYSHFLNGNVNNRFHPIICGVGYIGNTNSKINNIKKKSYNVWIKMIERCYNKDTQLKQPSYIGCSVCEDWLCYENFERWYNENYYEIGKERMCLDKDILTKGNKIYSPENCIIVPNFINVIFTKRKAKRGNFPIGVTYHKKNKVYVSYCDTMKEKRKYLGSYKTPNEAFYSYKNFKESYIKEIANQYKNKIPIKLYNAMLAYEVEITD